MKLLRAALRSPAALVGLAIVVLFLFVSLFAPLIAPYDPLKTIVPLQLPGAAAPDGGHFWLGTDLLGRDILSRMIYGTRTVLLWSTIATASAFIIGVMAGLLAGYFQGITDTAMSFLANALLSFPVMVLYIIIITSFGASGTNIVVAVSFGSAPAVFRITRALVMDVRERDYVAAAITQGEGHLAVMLREILPNVTTPLIADLCLRLGYTAITIGVLGFLGLGLPPPTPDWGSMAAEGKAMAIVFPHMVVFPCVAISLLMLGLSLLSDGLREAAKRVVPA
ncbi:peptide/nickel transport system permease protein [Rhizobiales bacterium GAS113]|nr:peptide/nickel transport system permease protein [Rhizobiales bacterium GAS113]